MIKVLYSCDFFIFQTQMGDGFKKLLIIAFFFFLMFRISSMSYQHLSCYWSLLLRICASLSDFLAFLLVKSFFHICIKVLYNSHQMFNLFRVFNSKFFKSVFCDETQVFKCIEPIFKDQLRNLIGDASLLKVKVDEV